MQNGSHGLERSGHSGTRELFSIFGRNGTELVPLGGTELNDLCVVLELQLLDKEPRQNQLHFDVPSTGRERES